MRKTEIAAWTEEWGKQYLIEKSLLEAVFKDNLVHIFHIGSTSIPTIGYAKPIIDILIVVNNIDKVDLYNNQMLALDYVPKGENGIEGRRYFSKGKNQKTHHVHIFQTGHEHIKIHLDFKAYLIKNPVEAKKYGDLKVILKNQYPNNHEKYQEGKQNFVNELVVKAQRWALQREISHFN